MDKDGHDRHALPVLTPMHRPKAPSRVIPLPAPFSAGMAVEHLRSSSYGVAYRSTGDGALQRPVVIDGRAVAAEFRFLEGDGGALEVSVLPGGGGGDADPSLVDQAAQIGRSIFALDDPLAECYAALNREPVMARLVQAFHGLRMVRAPDLYETLLIAIVGQQVSVASAQALRKRLMEGLGSVVEADGVRWRAFPTAEQITEVSLERLRELGMSRQKAGYLKELARRTAGGDLRAESFRPLSDGEALARLTDCPGIGRWTAEVALMRGLGRMDAFPAGDVGLQNAVQRLLLLERRPTERELRALAERWAGWRSYAALYLWTSLRSGAFA